mgnify:CR=1 FL=1
MSVTIKDVSKDAGVSIKTVSRVINNEENVSESTKEKVLKSVTKLGFKPNKSAQSLRSKRSYMIALLYDNPNKSYLADVQRGILQACKRTGYNLVLQECNHEDESISSSIIEFVNDFKIDGLIITPPLSDMDEFLDDLDNENIEYSIIAPSTKKASSPYVSSNDYDASYEMTTKIIEYGHQKIGFVKGHEMHSASSLRFNGFINAMDERSLDRNFDWIIQGDFSFESGFQAGEKIFSSTDQPTAIFASNDSMAAGVMKSAQMKKILIPDELSIVGFDDSPTAEQVWPSLSTVKQPVNEMALHAAKLLIGEFDGLTEKTVSKEFKSEIIIRESLKKLN